MSVAQGAYKVEHFAKKIEDGTSAEKEAKIVEQGDGFLLFEGKAFGKHGYFVRVDIAPIGGLVSGCSTPMAQGFPLAQAKKVLEACQSITQRTQPGVVELADRDVLLESPPAALDVLGVHDEPAPPDGQCVERAAQRPGVSTRSCSILSREDAGRITLTAGSA